MEERGTPAPAWERVARCAPGGLARCLDSAYSTADKPTTSPPTSRSGWSGSRRSRACCGRRLHAGSAPPRCESRCATMMCGPERRGIRRWPSRGLMRRCRGTPATRAASRSPSTSTALQQRQRRKLGPRRDRHGGRRRVHRLRCPGRHLYRRRKKAFQLAELHRHRRDKMINGGDKCLGRRSGGRRMPPVPTSVRDILDPPAISKRGVIGSDPGLRLSQWLAGTPVIQTGEMRGSQSKGFPRLSGYRQAELQAPAMPASP